MVTVAIFGQSAMTIASTDGGISFSKAYTIPIMSTILHTSQSIPGRWNSLRVMSSAHIRTRLLFLGKVSWWIQDKDDSMIVLDHIGEDQPSYPISSSSTTLQAHVKNIPMPSVLSTSTPSPRSGPQGFPTGILPLCGRTFTWSMRSIVDPRTREAQGLP